MGFSTAAAQIIFFIAVVGISAGVISLFSNYVDQAQGAMSDKQQYITSQLRTDISVTNIDNTSGHLHVFVKNVGNEQLDTECIDLFVDSGWVTLAANEIVNPSTDSAVTAFDPEDTIQLKPSTAPLNSGSIHEAKIVTCNGISDTEDFSD
jgi:archaellum component FlaG (FlaF/FlaG flagellin family)